MRDFSYNHLDRLEIQFLQWTGFNPSGQAKETHGVDQLPSQTQPSTSEDDSKNGGPCDVAHTTFSVDANLAPPFVHGHAQNSSNAIQCGPWLLA